MKRNWNSWRAGVVGLNQTKTILEWGRYGFFLEPHTCCQVLCTQWVYNLHFCVVNSLSIQNSRPKPSTCIVCMSDAISYIFRHTERSIYMHLCVSSLITILFTYLPQEYIAILAQSVDCLADVDVEPDEEPERSKLQAGRVNTTV